MTDSELDVFFIETLKFILEDIKDCSEYTKNIKTPEYEEINADYLNSINELTVVLNKCKSIDDFANMDDDIIDSTYEHIACHADNFIISAEEPQHTEDLKNYSKLEELLNLFIDDDFDEDDFENDN